MELFHPTEKLFFGSTLDLTSGSQALQALRRYPLPLRTSHEVTDLEGMGKARSFGELIDHKDLGWGDSNSEWVLLPGLVGIFKVRPTGFLFLKRVPPYKDFGKKGNQVTVIFHSLKGQNEIK